ncbi:ABC transporter ATP-binding protein [Nocardia sp. NPDC056541]|uniref:ABC transporter ATP-binding protein n=1 Tax=Nocardia sp. NPDC056541 TaxID=3345860 RepID=UPI0036709A34
MTMSNLGVLIGYARPHTRTLLIGLVLALGSSATVMATPMVTKSILDALGTGASIMGPTGALLVLLVIGAALGWGYWILLGTVAENIVFDARTMLVGRLLGATVPSVQARPTGELVTRVTADTLLLKEAASSAVIGIINATFLTVGTVILMGVLDLMLLGVTMLAIIVVGILFGTLMPRIAKADAQTQESLGRLGGVLEGSLRSVRTVKAARAEHRIATLIGADASNARTHAIESVRVSATAWTVAWTGVQGAIIAILAIGAWRVDNGSLTVSTLIAFLLYAFTLMGPIQELTTHITAMQSGIAAAMRIREMETLHSEADVAHEPAPATAAEPDAAVRFDAVTVRYAPDAPHALKELTLRIPATGHTAIVGPSGAGKTTVFSTILRFVEPDTGTISVGGVAYRNLTMREVRARIAYVEQESPLVPGTLRDNLLFLRNSATGDEVAEVLRLLRLDSVVAAQPKGLDTHVRDTDLSGGQRQRIAMARALLGDADVLLLDEATSQIDTLTEASIVEAIAVRARTHAVVTIAHRLSTVRHADRIVVMDDGSVRAVGTHDELMRADDLYARMVRAGGFA